ncbi:putative RNA polymerase sigma factor FecI [compost metagenome]
MRSPLSSDDLRQVYFSARDDLERMLRRRVHDKDLVADLIQDTFLRLDQIARPLPDPDQARQYIFRVAKNLAIDHQRKEGRRADILAGSTVLFEGQKASPEDIALANGQIRTIEAALDELPRHCRRILIMSRIHGMTHSEIAAELQVSKSLVEKYAVKALLHCRGKLDAF